MTLLTGTELVIAQVGHWNPGDVAYIRRVEFENVHLEGYDLVLLLLLQPRSFHSSGWPNPQGGYWEVEIVFHQVRDLVLTVCGPHDIQTPGFFLDDIRDRQWEGIHLLVGDDEGLTQEGIRFGARSAQIRRCEPAAEPPNASRIWRTYPGEYRPTD
jgi:hypothetical protein